MQPLAERRRPQNLEEYKGQDKLVGPDGVLRKVLKQGFVPSMILWGPPGVGKTTLARIIAREIEAPFFQLSAINSGVKDLREVISKAENSAFFDRASPILFVDEIHRFSKSQQDALLKAVEEGTITLIGATTENPSFEVISALLSRSQVYVLEPIAAHDLESIAMEAVTQDPILSSRDIVIDQYEALIQISGGDVRRLLNALELVINHHESDPVKIDNESVTSIISSQLRQYDKNGENHYDIISAFIKSVRGSDPNAAVYWLARMIAGGEDPKFICRRMIILAAEDIGLANPNALLMANTCFDTVHKIGYPEARIIMSQCAIYLATSPKSNSAYAAINEALASITRTGDLPVPLHLRNAPTSMMKNMGYGAGYQYAHNYTNSFVDQQYLPDQVQKSKFYEPGANPVERNTMDKLRQQWSEKYK